MAFDYSEIISTAQSLISEFGRPMQLVKMNPSPTDPAKPWRGAALPRTPAADVATVRGVAVDPKNANALGLSAQDSDFIKRAELIYVLGAGQDPKAFHEVVDGDQRWRIEGIEELRPGAETLLYFLAVKR